MKFIDQFLAITEAELKSYLRRIGTFTAGIVYPFLLAGVFYIVGSGLQGRPVNLEAWLYQVIGLTIFAIATIMTFSSARYVKEGLLTGRLEYILATPVNVFTIVFATAFSGGLFSLIYYLLVGIIATFVFLSVQKLIFFLLSIPVLLIALLPALGLNLIITGLSIVVKESDPLATFVISLVGAVSGFVYPITVMPYVLQVLGVSLPYFYAAEYVRATIEGYLHLVFRNPFPFLFIYLITGMLVYNYMDRTYIRKKGSLLW